MKLFKKEIINDRIVFWLLGFKITCKLPPKDLTQDNSSQVEFYLVDAFEIFHFFPIYEALLSAGINARIIAEPCAINSSKSWFDYHTAIKFLEKLKIDYRTKSNPHAKIAITTQNPKLLEKYRGKKAVLSYGVGLNKDNFSISKCTCKGCDIRLVHGVYQKKILSRYLDPEKIFIIGYPKHEKFFKRSVNYKDLKSKYNIITEKPIIVYFPTWDEDSSISMFASAIKKLKKEYFIVAKAHHCTYRLPEKVADKNTLYGIADIVLEGNSSFEDAVMLGDIALIDAKSGASSEVPYLNPKIKTFLLSPRKHLENYYNKDILSLVNIINTPEMLIKEINQHNNLQKNTINNCIDYFYESLSFSSVNLTVNILKGFLK